MSYISGLVQRLIHTFKNSSAQSIMKPKNWIHYPSFPSPFSLQDFLLELGEEGFPLLHLQITQLSTAERIFSALPYWYHKVSVEFHACSSCHTICPLQDSGCVPTYMMSSHSATSSQWRWPFQWLFCHLGRFGRFRPVWQTLYMPHFIGMRLLSCIIPFSFLK